MIAALAVVGAAHSQIKIPSILLHPLGFENMYGYIYKTLLR